MPRSGGGAQLKGSKQAIADLHFRRIPGWVVEKRLEGCWIQQETCEGG